MNCKRVEYRFCGKLCPVQLILVLVFYVISLVCFHSSPAQAFCSIQTVVKYSFRFLAMPIYRLVLVFSPIFYVKLTKTSFLNLID